MPQLKSNGEHIVEIAAMKFFNNKDWEFQLSAALPEGFKEVLIAEINQKLLELATIMSIAKK